MLLIAQATSTTPEQLRALRAHLPALARVDLDELELSLGLLPACVLGWVDEARGRALVAALAEEGLALALVGDHELHRTLIDPPPADDVLVELDLSPTFHPPTWLRASASRGLEVWHFVDWPRLASPLHELLGHIELDELLRPPRFVHLSADLDASTLVRLRDACARVRERGDVLPDPSRMRDGIGIALTLPEPPPLHIDAQSPEYGDAPRLLTVLDLLLALVLPRMPELAHLSSYIDSRRDGGSPSTRRRRGGSTRTRC
jgi:hypothetical protein